ncbi:hypothetical protein SGFS_053040 [Streptomyces graminofaciens]|uniref:BON domain-containing protein n=1 Tax=Streptomyces graminofaciens TaxID=68212 RepID=A0ABN5VN66_9ACTN|nr:hypothetical protein SGFS_053040 [Streptomyces graminofaciens]
MLREIEIQAVEDAQRKVDRSGPRSAAESRVVVSAGTGVALSGSLRPNGPPDVFQQGLADQVEPCRVRWQARLAVEEPVRRPGDPRDARPL